MFHIKRAIFFRESSSKMYNPLTFATSMVIAELPYSILCAICFFLPLYYMPGLQKETDRAGYQFFVILITEMFSVTLGQALASLTPSAFISSQFDPFIMITFALFCGVTIPAPQMPAFWRAWLYHLDPFTHLIGGMVTTGLYGLPVVCTSEELNRFVAPNGTNCGDYMKPFFENGGRGYLVSNTTQECEYCAYRIGDEFYTPLGLDYANRWRELGIFIAFVGSNIIILMMAVSSSSYNST
jgi:ATP-binding cassette, subfamily G (WHITE), member 2, SNQ2